MQIIQRLRKRENDVSPRRRVFSISAIHGVTRKSCRVAEVFKAMTAIPAGPIDASNPGNANARAFWELRRGSFYDLTHNLMARNKFFAKQRQFTLHDMQVGPADATGTHPQNYLPGLA